MKAVTFVFLACSLSFLSEFVSFADREDGIKPSKERFYDNVIRNSIASFLERRNREFTGTNSSADIVIIRKFSSLWIRKHGRIVVAAENQNFICNRGYNVIGVNVRGHRTDRAISIHIDLNIPAIAIQDSTWRFKGIWRRRRLNGTGSYAYGYTNVTVGIKLDLELDDFGFDNYLNLKKVTLNNTLIPAKPDFIFGPMNNFPRDLSMATIVMQMRPWIASEVEKTIFGFYRKNFGKCTWHRLMLGRF